MNLPSSLGWIDGIRDQLGWVVQLPWMVGDEERHRIDALRLLRQVPAISSLTLVDEMDRERADHQRLTLATEVEVYFCDPRSPWQRGSNENTNRLLRQYLPRGTDLSLHSQAKLSSIARQLNERPERPCYIRRRLRSSQNLLQRSVELAAELGHSLISAIRTGVIARSGTELRSWRRTRNR